MSCWNYSGAWLRCAALPWCVCATSPSPSPSRNNIKSTRLFIAGLQHFLLQRCTVPDSTLTIHSCSQHITLQYHLHSNHWRSRAPRPATRARFATAIPPRVANLPCPHAHLNRNCCTTSTHLDQTHLVPLIRRPPCRNPTMSSIITVRHSILEASSPI
jgi:hypothetical protein